MSDRGTFYEKYKWKTEHRYFIIMMYHKEEEKGEICIMIWRNGGIQAMSPEIIWRR